MDIVLLPFEESLKITLENSTTVELVAFPTTEHGNIKIGIKAPRDIKVNREEVIEAMKQSETISP